ncbi:hypothetical protein TNCV_2936451 [Trichonephila clavipes]|nr:hypothetical protein TNCV_2936451 [Trichonephila clavipes]
MFNVSLIRHKAQIKSMGEFIPNFFPRISEEILATSASVMCLKSERSAGCGGTYTQSFMNPHRFKLHGIRSDECGGHALQALSGGSLGPVHWLVTVIFNQSRTERCQTDAVFNVDEFRLTDRRMTSRFLEREPSPEKVPNDTEGSCRGAFVVEAYFSNGWSVVVVQLTFRRHFDVASRAAVDQWSSPDYFLWAYSKSLVYKDRSKILGDIRNNIRPEIDNIPVALLEKVAQSFRNRLYQSISNGGRHLTDIVFKTVNSKMQCCVVGVK